MSPNILEFAAPEVEARFRVRLLQDANPKVVAEVIKNLPLESTLGHVVVSGQAIWLPTRIVHLDGANMVKRSRGAVYLYAPGQSICLTYGVITESALVNKFGEVFEEDLGILAQLGDAVWSKTVSQPRRELVKVSIRAQQ